MVKIYLGLGVMMRWVGGPFARQVDDLAQNHVGIRRVIQIEAGTDIALSAAHQLARSPRGQVSSGPYMRQGKPCGSLFLNVNMAGSMSGDPDFDALADVQAGWVVIKRVRTVHVAGLPFHSSVQRPSEHQRGHLPRSSRKEMVSPASMTRSPTSIMVFFRILLPNGDIHYIPA